MRLQILELPSRHSDFVLVIDQVPKAEFISDLDDLKQQTGAKAVVVFERRVDVTYPTYPEETQ